MKIPPEILERVKTQDHEHVMPESHFCERTGYYHKDCVCSCEKCMDARRGFVATAAPIGEWTLRNSRPATPGVHRAWTGGDSKPGYGSNPPADTRIKRLKEQKT